MESWEADEARRRHMARFGRRDTAPELALRRELHRRGRRFFVDRQVSKRCRVRPDLVFQRSRVAVFVDGCFWHYCEEHAQLPKANAELWRRKLLANRQRDARNEAILVSEGWRVLRFWEHDDTRAAATKVEREIDRWDGITGSAGRPHGRMEHVVEVVAGVLTRADGTVLACRRAPGRSAAGMWEFPGGKVERDELPEAALARELREELGIDAVVGERIDRSTTTVGGTDIDLASYRIQWLSDQPVASSDHDELRWLSPAELTDVHWAEPDLPTVRLLQAARSTD